MDVLQFAGMLGGVSIGVIIADWRFRLAEHKRMAEMIAQIDAKRAEWVRDLQAYGEAHNSLALKIADMDDRLGGVQSFVRSGVKK